MGNAQIKKTYYLDITNYGWLPEPLKNAMLWIRTSAPTDPAKFEAYKAFAQSITILPDSFVPKAAEDAPKLVEISATKKKKVVSNL